MAGLRFRSGLLEDTRAMDWGREIMRLFKALSELESYRVKGLNPDVELYHMNGVRGS